MAAKDDLGKRGEELAAAFLAQRGYLILDRNWRCSQGEIDVVAQHDDETVFVEVKTRSSTAFGHPLEAITAAKLARLRRLAGAWCDEHPQPASPRRRLIRIDAIGVISPSHTPATIEHLERVF